ncbi:MAG: beta-lactamase family protein [Gemmatimonadaceae bacterium]|nr:beta-lactamase family protein [Gemmatimonadaceae bacterium]
MAAPVAAQAPRFVDSLFADMRRPTGPGCVIALDSAGRRRWTTVWGQRDLERGGRNDSTTRFEAGSVSKQVTAAAVVLLARQGRLSLDDDVRRWIPELPDLGRVTVRMLLTHQSGWRDWRNLTEMTRWTSEDATWTNGDVLALLTRQRALNFEPGSQYAYSNTNYVLAAILVERVSGQSLRAFTTAALFVPLGMRATTWRDEPGALFPRRAAGYSPRDDGTFRNDTPIESVVGPSGLLTTAGDLQRWLHNLDTEAVGGPGFRDDMERVGVLTSGRPTGYAMGLEVSTLGGLRAVSHAGWTGGYVAYAGRMPSRALSLVILCNGSAVNTDDLGPILLARAARVAGPPPEVRPSLGDTLTTGPQAQIAGLFRNQRTRAIVTVRAFARGITLNTWVGYTPAGPDRYRSNDGARELIAERDSSGAVPAFRLRSTDGDSVRYVRLAGDTATAGQLASFAGRYHNADTDAAITIALAGGRLVAQRGATLRDDVVPYFRDGFRVPSQSWVLTFQRDGAGVISAFDLSLPRTRQLVFTRQP